MITTQFWCAHRPTTRAKCRQRRFLTYFGSVADRSPLPVLLYNIPRFVPYQIPVEVVAELAQHPNIIGIKESSGSLDRIKA